MTRRTFFARLASCVGLAAAAPHVRAAAPSEKLHPSNIPMVSHVGYYHAGPFYVTQATTFTTQNGTTIHAVAGDSIMFDYTVKMS